MSSGREAPGDERPQVVFLWDKAPFKYVQRTHGGNASAQNIPTKFSPPSFMQQVFVRHLLCAAH